MSARSRARQRALLTAFDSPGTWKGPGRGRGFPDAWGLGQDALALGAAVDGEALDAGDEGALLDVAGDDGVTTEGVVVDGLDEAGVLQPITAPPMAPAIASASKVRLIMVRSPPNFRDAGRTGKVVRPSLTIQVRGDVAGRR
jgi:hypothetical protein